MVFKRTHVKRYRLRVQLYYVGTPKHIRTFVYLYDSTRDCAINRTFAQLYVCKIASRHKAGAKERRMELIQTPGHAGQLGGTLYMVIIARMTFKTNLFKD